LDEILVAFERVGKQTLCFLAAAMANGTCCFHYVARTVSLHPGKLCDLSPAGAAEVIFVTLSLHS